MRAMEGAPQRLLKRATNSLLGLTVGFALVGSAAILFGFGDHLPTIARIAIWAALGIFVIGACPMASMLAVFHAPAPLLFWLRDTPPSERPVQPDVSEADKAPRDLNRPPRQRASKRR